VPILARQYAAFDRGFYRINELSISRPVGIVELIERGFEILVVSGPQLRVYFGCQLVR
jgi:hypothetical protein